MNFHQNVQKKTTVYDIQVLALLGKDNLNYSYMEHYREEKLKAYWRETLLTLHQTRAMC